MPITLRPHALALFPRPVIGDFNPLSIAQSITRWTSIADTGRCHGNTIVSVAVVEDSDRQHKLHMPPPHPFTRSHPVIRSSHDAFQRHVADALDSQK